MRHQEIVPPSSPYPTTSRRPGSPDGHRRQWGGISLGDLLLIGLIVVPLIVALIIFRVEVYTFLIDRWVDVVGAPESSF